MRRYQRPRLLADTVQARGDDAIELRRGARTLSLTVAGERNLALAHLRRLQRGRLEHAAGTNDGNAIAPLLAVLDELDALGWIGEGQPPASNESNTLAAIVARGRSALNSLGDAARVALGKCLLWPTPTGRSAEQLLVAALHAQIRRESSHSEMLLKSILGDVPALADLHATNAPEDLRELEISVATLIFWALRGQIGPTPLPSVPKWRGPNVITAEVAQREAELLLRAWNEAAPEPALLALSWPKSTARSLARGIHQQQYYVSLHYPESILPLLVRNPPAPTRTLIWRYLLEELGHDDLEFTACRQLGLSAAQIRAAAPLPAFATFHRAMAHVAAIHPVAWVMALPLAEGLPGEHKPLPSLLARFGLKDPSFAAHVAVDETLDHAWMARRIAALMEPIDVATWRKSAHQLAALWCLTRVGWDQLVDHFGSNTNATAPISPWDYVNS